MTSYGQTPQYPPPGAGDPWGRQPGYGPQQPPPPGQPVAALWPIVVVTVFLALFGLIPTVLASNKASALRQPTSRYWIAFGVSMVGAIVLYTVVFLVVFFVILAGAVVAVGGAIAAIPSGSIPTGLPSVTSIPSTSPTSAGATTGPCGYTADTSGNPDNTAVPLPPDPDPTPTSTRTWTLTTSAGVVVVQLDGAAAPCTVQSMVHLTGLGYFDNTTCPRSVNADIFVLQCGDPSGTGSGGPSYTFKDENLANAAYSAGAVAMANAGPDTNGSQFFLVSQDSQLGQDYTVFGQITQGLDIVQAIVAAGNDGANPAGGGAPVTPISIVSASVS